MTAPAIHPDAIIAALPDLDADVACEMATHCPVGHRHRCDEPAVWRVRAHGYRDVRDRVCGVHTFLMCGTHLTELRTVLEEVVRQGGRTCKDCGLRARSVADILREVSAL
ncbi:hypothetical protein SEA_MARIDALIA_59 [Gordonia phage Maridalia]|uniref:Uncharacterized protein n=1 Tax=Gordonia phage Maridalia TaxID=2488957 RepID=A0A3G8FVP0_9CAUD|nr:tail fiber protein [Gordonia phage Maridalia]AZF98798.1 hypothetical protein SEA_MARIDALIA_59 [Gordonia phage Maridalia]